MHTDQARSWLLEFFNWDVHSINPDQRKPRSDHVSTPYAERSNLNIRMHTRRFTWLTNSFSKKVENHAHSVALFATYYNFVRIHKTLRTPRQWPQK